MPFHRGEAEHTASAANDFESYREPMSGSYGLQNTIEDDIVETKRPKIAPV